MLSSELERLQQLRASGALTEAEFQQAKQQVLQGGGASTATAGETAFSGQPLAADPFTDPHTAGVKPEPATVCGMSPRLWNALMHLSQLLTWTVLGIAVPIIMWIISKDESRESNRNGLVILNWLLSTLIYAVISGILCLLVIGIPMLIVLAALNIIFPIVGAIQANGGKVWRYPLSINFFDPDAV